MRKFEQLIVGKQWYHQGFDGSPMFLLTIAAAEMRIEKRKSRGTEADVRVCYFGNGIADWYLDMADIQRGAQKIIAMAKKDPYVSDKLLAAWQDDEQAFEDFFWKEFPTIKLSALSDQELLGLWQRYNNLLLNRFTSSSIIDHFALGTDQIIAGMLRRETGPLKRESEFTKIFSTATAPVHQSFINVAECDLLKIATGQSKMTLREYQQKYYWIKNNYIAVHVLGEKYFAREIAAWRKTKTDLRLKLRQIQSTPLLNRRRKAVLFRKYRLSRLLRTLLKISEDFTWWQDERKKSTFLNSHLGNEFLKEISKRTSYRNEKLKYAVATEIPGILSNHTPSLRELAAREKGSVFVMTRKGHYAATGREVERIRKMMLGALDHDRAQDIRGLSASLGKAIGRVKVLRSSREIDKVKTGDILVAVMTRPDYVSAMKRAAAIVTDEGGITSHAAIVSRELGVPCIIGTKIATSVFRDGEMVEVNANHGWIRKLQI